MGVLLEMWLLCNIIVFNIIVFKVDDRVQITFICFIHNNALPFCFNGLFANKSTSSPGSWIIWCNLKYRFVSLPAKGL